MWHYIPEHCTLHGPHCENFQVPCLNSFCIYIAPLWSLIYVKFSMYPKNCFRFYLNLTWESSIKSF
jgi:hypothetical protein